MAHPLDTALVTALQGARLVGAGPGSRGYRAGRILGEGSHALVLAGTSDVGVEVALKVFRPSFVRTFPAEARMVVHKEWTTLQHLRGGAPSPYLIGVVDLGTLDHAGGALPWLALDRAEGPSLKTRVSESLQYTQKGFSPRRALRVLGGVAEGLRALHEAGVIHRDLKPSNVLLDGVVPHENARIADLGVSRAAGISATFGVGAFTGAPGYAAPELTDPNRAGPRSDVFSLGALTYFVLTGEPMFGGSSYAALAAMRLGVFVPLTGQRGLHTGYAAASAVEAITRALRRATHSDPFARYESAWAFWAEMGAAIGRAAQTELGNPVAPSAPRRERTTQAFQLEDDGPEET